jgi:predicted P-loop ATPase/GTPase
MRKREVRKGVSVTLRGKKTKAVIRSHCCDGEHVFLDKPLGGFSAWHHSDLVRASDPAGEKP